MEKAILVPFPIGSAESGVDFKDKGLFVYEREFTLERYTSAKRYLLRVGACDYRSTVLVNGQTMGSHVGGYASFSFDITQAVKAGTNKVEIRVRDSHSPYQVRGKQTFLRKPFFVWYAGISGIWQSVWIEETGPARLERARVSFDFAGRTMGLSIPVDGTESQRPEAFDLRLSVVVKSCDGSGKVAVATAKAEGGSFEATIGFDEFNASLWSVDAPNLHPMTLTLASGDEVLDTVETYVGIREIGIGKEGLRINGSPVFLKMVLDQGYYPGGVYTPKDFSRLVEDIRTVKNLGFNGVRVHEKVESPYFSYLCDRLGLLASFEMPSFYLPSTACFENYESELRELILRDSAHPSCVLRMLFNETWGIWGAYKKSSKTRAFVLRMYALTKRLDPTRPVIENSGWEHFKTDIVDFHHYLRSSTLAREVYRGIKDGAEEIMEGFSIKRVLDFNLKNQVPTTTRSIYLEKPADAADLPLFLSEYGGFGWYDTDRKDAVIESIEEYTRDILDSGLFCGYCYTQLSDVGDEVNGLYTFDRKAKVDVARVRRVNDEAR
jgi:beta-galactosidase/beta-glucuronidase